MFSLIRLESNSLANDLILSWYTSICIFLPFSGNAKPPSRLFIQISHAFNYTCLIHRTTQYMCKCEQAKNRMKTPGGKKRWSVLAYTHTRKRETREGWKKSEGRVRNDETMALTQLIAVIEGARARAHAWWSFIIDFCESSFPEPRLIRATCVIPAISGFHCTSARPRLPIRPLIIYTRNFACLRTSNARRGCCRGRNAIAAREFYPYIFFPFFRWCGLLVRNARSESFAYFVKRRGCVDVFKGKD